MFDVHFHSQQLFRVLSQLINEDDLLVDVPFVSVLSSDSRATYLLPSQSLFFASSGKSMFAVVKKLICFVSNVCMTSTLIFY